MIEEIRDEFWGAAVGAVMLLLGLYMTAGLWGICAGIGAWLLGATVVRGILRPRVRRGDVNTRL
jgi:predicted PurR-regulated permease PerM